MVRNAGRVSIEGSYALLWSEPYFFRQISIFFLKKKDRNDHVVSIYNGLTSIFLKRWKNTSIFYSQATLRHFLKLFFVWFVFWSLRELKITQYAAVKIRDLHQMTNNICPIRKGLNKRSWCSFYTIPASVNLRIFRGSKICQYFGLLATVHR